jgi:hypothetical protein
VLGLPALFIAYVGPCFLYSRVRVRQDAGAVAATAASALLGCWLDRFAMAAAPGCSGLRLIDLGIAPGVAAWGALFVLWVLRKVSFPVAPPARTTRAPLRVAVVARLTRS